jgi:hypothetical protein
MKYLKFHILLKLFGILIFIIFTTFFSIIYYDPEYGLKIRKYFFTKNIDFDIKHIYKKNNEILFDDSETLKDYSEFKKSLSSNYLILPEKYKLNSELEKVLSIALITNKLNNGINAGGGTYVDLKDLEDHLLNPERGGRCSDYSEYFLSQLILNGFEAREVSNLNHTAVEVYLNSLNKWIWVDSQLDVLILDSNQNVLNAFEISNLEVDEIFFFPFNKNLENDYKKFPECYILNNPFQQIVYSIDSRVFKFDKLRKHFFDRKLHSIFVTIILEKNKLLYNENFRK